MKITKIGVKTGAIFCKKCGEILQIGMDMKKVECPSCGASSPRSKLIGDGGDFGHFVEEPVPGHSSTRVQRKIFAQMAGGRQWRIHFFVRGPGVDLPLTLKNANPDGEGWIVDYNSGCHGYFVSRLFEGGQDGLKAILRAIPSFVQEGKDRARDALLRKIDGAGAIDIGSSSFAQHEDECAKAQILKDLGWKCWESGGITHRGAMTTNKWFRPDQQGVADLVGLLFCEFDRQNSTIFVPHGQEGRIIGKQGVKIKMLSEAYGKHLIIKSR